MRTSSWSAITVAALAATAVACSAPTSADTASSGSVVIGATPGTMYIPSYTGVQAGYFADRNLDVDIVQLQGTGPTLAGMASGDINISMQDALTVIEANRKGADLRFFCGTGARVERLAVRPDSTLPAATPDDWESAVRQWSGRTFGVVTLGGLAETWIRQTAQSAGVSPDELTFVAVGYGESAVNALEQGLIDYLFAPYFQEVVFGSRLRIVYDAAQHGPVDQRRQQTALWTASKAWLSENADTAHEFCSTTGTIIGDIENGTALDTVIDTLTTHFSLSPEVAEQLADAPDLRALFRNDLDCESFRSTVEYSLGSDSAEQACEQLLWKGA